MATTYRVLRSETTGGPYDVVVAGLTGLNYSDTNLPSSQALYYVVEAVYDDGSVVRSNEASAQTAAMWASIAGQWDEHPESWEET